MNWWPSTAMSDVTLLDVNVLVALALGHHQHHLDAIGALDTMDRWATTGVTEAAFLRLMLNPKVGGRTDPAAVVEQLRAMKRHPACIFLPDQASLVDSGLSLTTLAGHHQVTDLHLVSIARQHGAVLGTFDRALPGALAPADRKHVRVLPVR